VYYRYYAQNKHGVRDQIAGEKKKRKEKEKVLIGTGKQSESMFFSHSTEKRGPFVAFFIQVKITRQPGRRKNDIGLSTIFVLRKSIKGI